MDKENFPSKKSKLIELIDKENFDFTLKVPFGEDKFIVGFLGKNSKENNNFSLLSFFNAFQNTKENAFKGINEYLNLNDENLLPNDDSFLQYMFNPYIKMEQYYSLENIIIRVGSLWDELAHICNIIYNLGISVRRVKGSIFNNINEQLRHDNTILNEIYLYYNDDESFAEINCHAFCIKLRNRLIHYCDFNAMKFLSEYMNEEENLNFYPIGYYFGCVIFDMFKAIEFAKAIYNEYEEQ